MALVMRCKKNNHYPISALLLCFPKMATAPFPVPLALPEPCYSPSRAEPISPLAPGSLGGHLECGEKDTAWLPRLGHRSAWLPSGPLAQDTPPQDPAAMLWGSSDHLERTCVGMQPAAWLRALFSSQHQPCQVRNAPSAHPSPAFKSSQLRPNPYRAKTSPLLSPAQIPDP